MVREGVAASRMRFERTADLRYVGQSYQLSLPLPDRPIEAGDVVDLRRRFDAMHLATYGYAEAREPCELVALRMSAIGEIGKPSYEVGLAEGDANAAAKSSRRVYFASRGFLDCSIYDRGKLPLGARIEGPAVIEERDSTTLVHPGWGADVSRLGVPTLSWHAAVEAVKEAA